MNPEIGYARERASLLKEILEEVTEKIKVDCHKGCVYCCYGVTLWIKRAEALLLTDFLNSLPLKERKNLWDRIKKYARLYEEEARRVGYLPTHPIREEELDVEKLGVIGGLGMNEVPCPFLNESGECVVYEARPDMCRLMVYEDSSLCKKDWENPLAFVWKNEIAPFVEGVKKEFYARWKLRRAELADRFPDVDIDKMEEEVGFITHLIRFDPVKKVFKLIY